MRIRLSLLLSLSFYLSTYAQVDFHNKNIDWAVMRAIQEDKMVFVDVYTTWCAPCKKMDKTTFQDSVVAELMNEKFVAVKWDAESEVYDSIVAALGVNSYPSFLFINQQNQVIVKMTGYMPSETFIEEVNGILLQVDKLESIENIDLSTLTMPEMHDILMDMRNVRFDQKKDLFKEYYRNIADEDSLSWDEKIILIDNLSQENLHIVEKIIEQSEPISPFTSNFRKYIDANSKVNSVFRMEINEAIQQDDLVRMNRVLNYRAQFAEVNIIKGQQQQSLAIKDNRKDLLRFYKYNEHKEHYYALSDSMITEYILPYSVDEIKKQDEYQAKFTAQLSTNLEEELGNRSKRDSLEINYFSSCTAANRLNEISSTYLEFYTDEERLQKAQSWSALSIEFCPLPEYQLNHAKLLVKNDQIKQAQIELKDALTSPYMTDGIEEDIKIFQSELLKVQR